ncbi:MAG: PD40 domain-containing protein [Muribaculaceae bacterium]|nr:PD40 domain-containing protein [Muribaculaceae bacterium]
MKHHISLILAASLLFLSCSNHKKAEHTDRVPEIYPDFAGSTLPANIAAPTFEINEDGSDFFTEIGKEGEEPVMTFSSKEIRPDLKKWHKLLAEAAGKNIYIRISVRNNEGKWERMKDIICPVSSEPIDEYLVYRLLYPGYELWNEMGIYQRNLTDYQQEVVLENLSIDKQCVNCHSFSKNAPETMMIHVRGKQGGTLIRKDGTTEKVDPKCPGLENGATYPSWHSSGRFIAYSANNIQQFFHSKGTKTIEVSDLSADMTIYDVDNGKAFTSPAISGDEWMETFPNWTPDGKTLYFCRSKAYKQGDPLDSVRYDLCKVSFDPDSLTIGEPEIVLNASEQGKSVSFPRVSPDGRWLLFTLSDYGNFSIWHPESDLYLLDLQTGDIRLVDELNSDDVDSYHSWSSNGKWLVFSSKRMDGLWARPFIASFNPETGIFTKPFVVPQKDPHYYDDFMKTYNIPELVRRPILNTDEFVSAVKKS